MFLISYTSLLLLRTVNIYIWKYITNLPVTQIVIKSDWHIDDLVQDSSISIAKALATQWSCTKYFSTSCITTRCVLCFSNVRNIANRYAAVPKWETMKQSSWVWNSLDYYFWCRPWYFVKISLKSVHPFFHIATDNHGSRKWKNRSWFQGVNCKI